MNPGDEFGCWSVIHYAVLVIEMNLITPKSISHFPIMCCITGLIITQKIYNAKFG